MLHRYSGQSDRQTGTPILVSGINHWCRNRARNRVCPHEYPDRNGTHPISLVIRHLVSRSGTSDAESSRVEVPRHRLAGLGSFRYSRSTS
jgi:hypothetical protein